MNEKCKESFIKAGYWPNEVMWIAWQQSWAMATEDTEDRAAQAYKMQENRLDNLRTALESAACGIDTAYADIERDCVDKAKECLTRYSLNIENVLRHN